MAPDDDVLQQLSLPEKASLCLGADFWHTAAVERLGVPGVLVSDGPHGLRAQPGDADQNDAVSDSTQHQHTDDSAEDAIR